MDELLTEDLKLQYDALPVELQDAISSADLPRKFEAITKDNKLMIDQAGKFEMETLFVLLGLQPLKNYIDNLVKNAGLSRVQAASVADDVNELIFKNIRETLQKINEDAEATETGENPAASEVQQPAQEETIPETENPVETENNLLPEIYPETAVSAESVLTPKQEPYHENISPVENIVESKMTGPVIVPKETVVVEEKTKLPDLPAQAEKTRPSDSTDPYREPIN